MHKRGLRTEYHTGTSVLCYWANSGHIRYLQLDDLTKDFRRPCVLDVKIGAQTWDPDASAEKIHCERNKYPPLSSLGFRLLGMKVFNPWTDAYVTRGKRWGLSLTEATVLSG